MRTDQYWIDFLSGLLLLVTLSEWCDENGGKIGVHAEKCPARLKQRCAEYQEESGMTARVLYRIGGGSLALGGVLGMVVAVLHPEDVRDPRQPVLHLLLYFAIMLILLGLPAVCVQQATRAGLPSLVGAGLIFFGLPFIDLLYAVLFFSVVPVLNTDPALRPFLDENTGIGTKIFRDTALGLLQGLAFPMLVLGTLLLAFGTLRAGVLPRWPAIALLLSPIALVAPLIAQPLGFLAPLMLYLSLALFGLTVITRSDTESFPRTQREAAIVPIPDGNV